MEAVEGMSDAGKSLRPSFSLLCDLGNIFLMRSDNLRAYLSEGSMAHLDARFTIPFVAQRADWKAARVDKMFPELAQNNSLASFFALTAHDF